MENASAIAESASPAEDVILEAAEHAFAEHGFDGTGMKAIAQRAGVSQALLHYHFGTKQGLYNEVIRRRSAMINEQRHALLDRIDTSAPDALSCILFALYQPPFGPSGGAAPYAKIFAELIVGRERDQALIRECYDPTALRFIDALKRLNPRASHEAATLSYSLALGALVAVINRNGRAERLIGHKPEDPLLETDHILSTLIDFAAGGVRAVLNIKQDAL